MCGLCGIKFPIGQFTCVDCKWYSHKHKGHRPKTKEVTLPYSKEFHGRCWEAKVPVRKPLHPSVGRDILGPGGVQFNTENSVSTCSETQSLKDYFEPAVAPDNIINNPTYAGALAIFGAVRGSSPSRNKRVDQEQQDKKDAKIAQDRLLSFDSSTPRRLSAKKLNKSRAEHLREEQEKKNELDAKNAEFLRTVKHKREKEGAKVQAAAHRKADGTLDPMFLRFLRGEVSDPKCHAKNNRENALADGVHRLWLPGHAAMAKIQSHVAAQAEDVRDMKEREIAQEQRRRADERVRYIEEYYATKRHLEELEEAKNPKPVNPYADLEYNSELWDEDEEQEEEAGGNNGKGGSGGARSGSDGRGVGFGSLPGSRAPSRGGSRPSSRSGGTVNMNGSRRGSRYGSPSHSRMGSRAGSRPGSRGTGGMNTMGAYVPEKLRPMSRGQDSKHHIRPFRTASPEMHMIGSHVRSPSPTSMTPTAHSLLKKIA